MLSMTVINWTRRALYLSLTGLISISMNASASSSMPSMISPAPSSLPSFVASLSGGVSWVHAGEVQTFFLTPDIEKTFTADRHTQALANGELFVGLQKTVVKKLEGQVGVVLAATKATNLSGLIWEDADPQFANHSYSYKIRHRYIGVQGKLLYDAGSFMPWISGSVGIGMNKSFDYSNTSLIFQALPETNFADHTTKMLAWTFGIGAQKKLTKHWQIGISYELADWGKARLDRANQQSLNTGLALKHIYANGFLVNITFVG